MLHAKNACLSLAGGEMDYIRFGSGARTLVMLPGVGDGLKTVRGMALPFALLYRALAKDFTVYVFSRRRALPRQFTTREMAEDCSAAMAALQLSDAAVVGVSQGGMIAQHLAAAHPELVAKLVLAVTAPRANHMVETACQGWIAMAERGDYAALLRDTAEKTYTAEYLAKAKAGLAVTSRLGRPKDFTRFILEAQACMTHDGTEVLGKIACPTLVIGAEEDKIVGCEASRELSEAIPDASLSLFPRYGHGVYEETEAFHRYVREAFS